MVFKCDSDIVVKAVRNADDYTEYTTIQYLEKNNPTVPAPRPLRLLRTNRISPTFMSYIPEKILGDIWAQLDSTQKMSIQEQLNQILVDLRSVTPPDGMCLGGVAREGCKDAKRHLRRSTTIRQNTIPIVSVKDFEGFQFPQPSFPGHVFADFLHQFSPLRQSSLPVQCRCVFTHGVIQPDNIAVQVSDGNCQITGLLDWEYSGF